MVTLGILFWTGNADALVPVHMLVGILIVLSLWTMAVLAAVAGAPPGQVALAVVWGFVVPVLGVTQQGLLPGGPHWVIQVLHLLVGLFAIGQVEGLAQAVLRGRGRGTAAAPESAQ
jgi:hypothetical protein